MSLRIFKGHLVPSLYCLLPLNFNLLSNHIRTHIISKQRQQLTMESIKNAANSVSESVQGAGATASKETNKQVAKDSNADASTRYVIISHAVLTHVADNANSLTAAKDAVSDKIDEASHNTKADAHKEAAK